MTDICEWCHTNRIEAAKRFEGPHATWCVHFRESQRGGDPKDRLDPPKLLIDLMPSAADFRAEVIVKRALNQIGNALKDHGLFVTVDTDGNYGVGRLPAEFPIKDERVSDHLRRVIHDRIAHNRPLAGLRISDKDARKLAAELAELQFNQPITEAEIYAGLVDGGSRFLDLPVEVYWT